MRPGRHKKQLPENTADLYRAGKTQQEIADLYKTTPRVVRRKLQQMGVEMRPAKRPLKTELDLVDQEIIKLRKLGLSQRSVGGCLGCTQQAIEQRERRWRK